MALQPRPTEASPGVAASEPDHATTPAGAYWCSHCGDQKEALGAEAFATLPYVECAADGRDANRALCTSAGITGYPKWQIDGKLYSGEKDLAGLEEILETSKPTSK